MPVEVLEPSTDERKVKYFLTDVVVIIETLFLFFFLFPYRVTVTAIHLKCFFILFTIYN